PDSRCTVMTPARSCPRHHGGRVREERKSHPTAAITTNHPSQDHGAGGSAAAPTVATASTHHTPHPTGAITTGAPAPAAPARRHAGSPTSITRPATGTATRLATVPISDSRPNTSRLGSATPTWAPIVTATGSASGPSRPSRGARWVAPTVTPAVAPTDS